MEREEGERGGREGEKGCLQITVTVAVEREKVTSGVSFAFSGGRCVHAADDTSVLEHQLPLPDWCLAVEEPEIHIVTHEPHL